MLCATPTVGQIGGTGGGTGFGNIGGGAVLGPPQNNWDMSIAKLFPIRESRSLQFRAEYFNTFNHPQFNIPVLTANTANFWRDYYSGGGSANYSARAEVLVLARGPEQGN